MSETIHVVGMGDDGPRGLSEDMRTLIHRARTLIGGERHLSFFPDHPARKIPLKGKFASILEEVDRCSREGNTVVLASGDPLFYGIAKNLIARFGKDRITVHPAVSSMQLAFSRIRESWDEAVLVSSHAKPVEGVVEAAQDARKIGIFTEDGNTPSRIAEALRDAGMGPFHAYVCENLGGSDERIVDAPLEDLVGRQFAPLNVLILLREGAERTYAISHQSFGIPEEAFEQKKPRRGLITKWEVRSVSLARLDLTPTSVVWDVGAGSGAIAIEAARLCAQGMVYAVEKDRDDVEIIHRNRSRFQVENLVVVHGRAPESLEALPDPDAVFVGGSGGELTDILRCVVTRLRPGGRLVANFTTVENLHAGLDTLRSSGLNPRASLVQVARSMPILDMIAFESLNPVYVVHARLPQRDRLAPAGADNTPVSNHLLRNPS